MSLTTTQIQTLRDASYMIAEANSKLSFLKAELEAEENWVETPDLGAILMNLERVLGNDQEGAAAGTINNYIRGLVFNSGKER